MSYAWLSFVLILFLAIICVAGTLNTQTRRIEVLVTDGKQPVVGVRIRPTPGGVVSQGTDRNGRTWISIPQSTRPGSNLTLDLLNPPGKDWVFYGQNLVINVPPIEPELPNSLMALRLFERGSTGILRNPEILVGSAMQILRKMTPSQLAARLSPGQRAAVLEAEAMRIGVLPADLQKALTLGLPQLKDPYQKAIVEMFNERFADALPLLEQAYDKRHSELVDVTSKRGVTLFHLGRYVESAHFLDEALRLRPGNSGVMADLGVVLLLVGDLARAQSLFEDALSRISNDAAGDGQLRLYTLLHIGWVKRLRADFKGAEATYTEAYKFAATHFENNGVEMAACYTGIGTLRLAQSKPTEANVEFEKSLRIHRDRKNGEFEVADLQINIALALLGKYELDEMRKRLDEAEELMSRMVKEKRIEEFHPRFAELNSLYGAIFENKGDNSQASARFEKAVAILEHNKLTKSPQYAYAIGNLGTSDYRAGRNEMAIARITKSVEINISALGPKHPHLAKAYISLGAIYQNKGDFKNSEDVLERAVAILLDKPEFEIDLANAYANRGGLFQTKNMPVEAEKDFTKAVAIRRNYKDRLPIQYSADLVNLGSAYMRRGSFADAEQLFKEALAIREMLPGHDSDFIAEVLQLYGMLFAIQKKLDVARLHWERALKLTDRPPDRAILARNLNNLGGLNQEQGLLSEAETLLSRSYSMWIRLGRGNSAQDISRTCQRYSKVLADQGKAVPQDVQNCVTRFAPKQTP